MSHLNIITYAEKLAELIQFKKDQMVKNSAMLAGKAAISQTAADIIKDQEAYDSFNQKKWLIKLEIEELKTKHRNALRLLGVSTPEEVDHEHDAWILRTRFNSMVHAHEIMKMTAGEMERIHSVAKVIKDVKTYWQHQIAVCEKAVADYLAAKRAREKKVLAAAIAYSMK